MAPIRVGIIGLSSRAKTGWASAAHLPYLTIAKDKYTITALCNSTVDSAKSAIKDYGLATTTKAYGDPHDMANDQEVDLVVCSTRADIHHGTIKPSIEQGKDVYVEWPLAQGLKHAEELRNLAKEKGCRTMVGLQCRESPIILKVKSLVEQGKIGKVLSSSIIAAGCTNDRNILPASLKYFTDKRVGGNILTIYIGHISDYVQLVLGEISSLTSKLTIQRPEVNIRGNDGTVVETVTSDVPDHILIIGELSSGAPLSFSLRRGQPFKGSPGFVWNIHGELGEIRVTASSPTFPVFGTDACIEVHDFGRDDLEDVPWEWNATTLPMPARCVGRLYDQFSLGTKGQYPDFDVATRRHRQIEALFESFQEGKSVAFD